MDSHVDDLMEIRVAEMLAGLRAMQSLQASYDEVGWRIEEPSWAKARHLIYHLLKAVTALAQLVESVEHAEERGETPTSEEFRALLAENPRISADLVFHAAQIANLASADLGQELLQLWTRNAQRFAPGSAFASLGE